MSNQQTLTLKKTINQYYNMVNIQIAAEAMWNQSDRSTLPDHAFPITEINAGIIEQGNVHFTKEI